MGSALGITPQTPPARNIGKEFNQTLSGFLKTAPGFYNLESQYDPLYGQLNLRDLAQQQFGYMDPATGQYHPGTTALSSAARGSDVQDVLNLGPAATAAFLQANPYLAGALGNLYGRTADSPILSTLNAQALNALRSGGQLTPQEQRDIEQQTRAGFAQRGMATGNAALGAELLNRDSAVRARVAAGQQFATGVEGLNQGQTRNVAGAAGTFASTLSDPFQAILGRPGQSGVMPVNRMFNPESSYASDLYNTNYNAQAASNIAGANNTSALYGAIIKSIGQAASGAAASDRRLKKNIKKLGTSPAGLGVYKFQYKGGKKTFIGPMAQDVERTRPDAVFRYPIEKAAVKNPRFVQMNKIDVPFMELGKRLAA